MIYETTISTPEGEVILAFPFATLKMAKRFASDYVDMVINTPLRNTSNGVSRPLRNVFAQGPISEEDV